ncbi:MAG TPA: hypothetical protein DDW52_13780 [Planctomycetaceae bacterium]|nr:hypothetical protein [Planctomycetaceae bacterium]
MTLRGLSTSSLAMVYLSMSSDEWFRRTTWTEEDRSDFNARLKRTRKHNRPQYLRIQAAHLAGIGNHAAALELLEQFLGVDDASLELAQAQLQRAESLLATVNEADAIDAFRASLNAERARPNVQTETWLLYPWYIVETQNEQLYSEAHAILREFRELRSSAFPVSDYRFHCVKAVLLAHEGELAEARTHAEQALVAANAEHSGYRYHPESGLVQDTDTTVHQRVSEIAAV